MSPATIQKSDLLFKLRLVLSQFSAHGLRMESVADILEKATGRYIQLQLATIGNRYFLFTKITKFRRKMLIYANSAKNTHVFRKGMSFL